MKATMTQSSVEAVRLRFDSARSCDEVKAALLAQMGAMKPETMTAILQTAKTGEDFERELRPFIGKSGFTLLAEFDHSRWLSLYGISARVVRLIFGNPTIAITMIRHDLTAALFAPVEVLLFDRVDGSGCSVVYDLPSSLMQAHRTAEFLAAAESLDAKLQALVSQATGVAVG